MTSEKEWMERHLASVTPLPFGERTAPRRRWAWARRRVRVRPRSIRRGIVVAGVTGAIWGIVLAVWPVDFRVSMDGTSYRLGDDRLVETAPGVFHGDGVLVIAKRSDGSVVAAGSFVQGGRRGIGTCHVDEREETERCTFHIDGRPVLDAIDVYVAGAGWSRRYLDGAEVTIAAQRPVPVPFPVGAT